MVIKKLPILFLMLAACGCSKSNNKPSTASLNIVVYQTDTLRGDDSTVAHLANASIAVWKEKAAGEITIKNATDGNLGIGYNSSNMQVKADFYVSSADSLTVKNVTPGLYLIYVVDHYQYDIAFPYSFKEVEVTGNVRLPKVFNYNIKNLRSPWDD